MKKWIPLCLLFLFCLNSFSQKDTVKKNCISVNIIQMAVNGEAGLYFDKNISKRFGIEILYGHRFWNFNLVKPGGPDSKIYFPQTADVIKVGLKSFIDHKEGLYYSIRLGYMNTHTPKYWERFGSGGLDDTPISNVSVDKDLFHLSAAFGKEYYPGKHLFINSFFAIGACFGTKKIHYYGDAQNAFSEDRIHYRDDHKYASAGFPVIEFGLKIGFRI